MKRKASSGTDANRWPECALASTRRAARLLTQLYDSHLSEHGIEAAQFALLMMVESAADKGQAEIAQALGMDKTTLSRNLKVLRSKGWVDAEAGSDARRRHLSLTPQGRAVLTSARPGWRRAQESLRSAMSEREWAAMLSTIETITRAAVTAAEKTNLSKV